MSDFFSKLRRLGAVEILERSRQKLLQPVFGTHYRPNVADEGFEPQPGTDIERLFFEKTGNQVTKWHHYLEIYDRHLSHLRGTRFKMLEIGVFRGGSLELWRNYFGPDAEIWGVDINPACAEFDGLSGNVRIGSQADKSFLHSVVDEMGGVDVIIDDGSHDSRHIKASFDALFPRLSEGGQYIVEDLHCSYWLEYSGGYRWPWSFINQSKKMIDDMHHWYHPKGQKVAATRGTLKAMHIYDSVMVFDKATVPRPVMSYRPKK